MNYNINPECISLAVLIGPAPNLSVQKPLSEGGIGYIRGSTLSLPSFAHKG